jgi:pimeloyl-ACP methyl ester carboxylesterase
MVSPYEIAYLCGDAGAYRPDSQVRPMSYAISIPRAGEWGVEAHDGVSNSFFCTKFIKSGSFEEVIAFRGTGGRIADVLVDLQHLYMRSSHYIDAARRFMTRYGRRDTIVAGHSLGGFIAISMAFQFTVKVVAINPPWVMGKVEAMIDQFNATQSRSFESSKIIVYQSTTDVVTAATHATRLRAGNLQFIRIGAVGLHGIQPIIENFSRTRTHAISWGS